MHNKVATFPQHYIFIWIRTVLIQLELSSTAPGPPLLVWKRVELVFWSIFSVFVKFALQADTGLYNLLILHTYSSLLLNVSVFWSNTGCNSITTVIYSFTTLVVYLNNLDKRGLSTNISCKESKIFFAFEVRLTIFKLFVSEQDVSFCWWD